MLDKNLQIKKSEYLLELAFEEQLENDEDLKKYSEEVVEHHEFSARHEEMMKGLFKMAEKKEHGPARRKKCVQLTAGVILALCCSTIMVTQVDAFRVPVYNFFIEVKDKATRFGVSEDDRIEASEKYLAYMPAYTLKGYSISRIDEGEDYFNIGYVHEKSGKSYNFRYHESMEDIVIDTEDADTEEAEIDGNHAYIIQKEGYIRILLHKEDHLFYLAGSLTREDAIKIMKSIK